MKPAAVPDLIRDLFRRVRKSEAPDQVRGREGFGLSRERPATAAVCTEMDQDRARSILKIPLTKNHNPLKSFNSAKCPHVDTARMHP